MILAHFAIYFYIHCGVIVDVTVEDHIGIQYQLQATEEDEKKMNEIVNLPDTEISVFEYTNCPDEVSA